MTTLGRCLMLGLTLTLLSGCSLKFAYNNLDRLVRWQVNDYVDLTSTQKSELQSQIQSLVHWHRREHLPQYADFFIGLADQAGDTVSVATIDSVFTQLELWGDEVESQALPGVIALLASLSDEQIADLPKRFEKDNKKMAKTESEGELADYQKAWAKDIESAVERFTGRLDKQQQSYIAQRSLGYQPERVLWADYRRRWQQELFALLAQRTQTEVFAPGLTRLVQNREQHYGEQLTKIAADNEQLSKEIVAHVLSNLSEKQVGRFADALRELGEDFSDLAAQAEA